MFTGKAKRDCTVPKKGYIEASAIVNFDIEAWDVKDYPYLKHFDKFDIFEEEVVEALADPFPTEPISIF